jgi:phosphotransferase system IIA component
MQCIYSVVARINYPDKGEVNINTNVAIFGMEKFGLGVAMLDEKGEVMLTASKPVDPPFSVEVGGAFAAQHGLLLATDTGCAVLF